MIKYTHGE
jgi:hypothetical protein